MRVSCFDGRRRSSTLGSSLLGVLVLDLTLRLLLVGFELADTLLELVSSQAVDVAFFEVVVGDLGTTPSF